MSSLSEIKSLTVYQRLAADQDRKFVENIDLLYDAHKQGKWFSETLSPYSKTLLEQADGISHSSVKGCSMALFSTQQPAQDFAENVDSYVYTAALQYDPLRTAPGGLVGWRNWVLGCTMDISRDFKLKERARLKVNQLYKEDGGEFFECGYPKDSQLWSKIAYQQIRRFLWRVIERGRFEFCSQIYIRGYTVQF